MAQWHVSRDGQQHGPYDDATLKQLAGQGRLAPTDHIWREGMADWVPASKLKGLFSDQPATAAPAAAAPSPQRPATRPASNAPASWNEPQAQHAPSSRAPGVRSGRRRAASKSSSGWNARLPMLCAIFMLTTLLLPWFIGEQTKFERVGGQMKRTTSTTVQMSWDVIDKAPTPMGVLLIGSWIISVAVIIVVFTVRGFPRSITFASLGGVGLVLMLVLVFEGVSMTGGRMSGGETALTIFDGIFMLGLIILTHLHLRHGPGKVLCLLQVIFASGALLFGVINLIMEFTNNSSDWNRARGDLEALVKILVIVKSVGILTGATLALLHGIKRSGRTLGVAGMWTIYVTIVGVLLIQGIAGAIESERFGLVLSILNTVFLFGGLLILFCNGLFQLLSDLIKRAVERVGIAQPVAAGAVPVASSGGAGTDIEAKFEKLESLLKNGHITQEQYEQKRAAMLDEM